MPAFEPLTPTGLIDEAVHVLKARPRTIVAIAACFAVPVGLLTGILNRGLLGGLSLTEAFNDPSTAEAAAESGTAAANVGAVLGVVLPSLLLPFMAAAYAHVVVGMRLGHEVTAGEALRRAGGKWWALLASWVVVHLAELVGAFIAIGSIVFMAFFLVVAPAIALEGLGPMKGLKRSWSLTSRRLLPVMGVGVASGIVAYVLGQALSALPDFAGLFVGLDVGWIILAAGRAATGLVIGPIIALTAVLCYLDLRVRLEGLDLELAIADHFGPEPLAPDTA